ncbi:substrate-binding domain-containing protein [Ochrobactrum sp. A-1]|uniref:substrate-binding domain-containing protein n=1 Tax=Ochrobactrum sp. A-1 TaxID=2920940 RepID=UPI001F0A466C|nr:substrate-binding domain-containing protein [Ochrobactrum sp. A-1]
MNLNELARELGLSKTTISRALNGFPEVSEETRKRVEAAAQQFGYIPNTNARRLAIGKSGAIGIVLPDHLSDRFGPQTNEFLSGLGEGLEPTSFDLLIRPSSGGDEMSVYRRWVSARSVDAIVISVPAYSDERVQMLSDAKFPFVVHGKTDISAPHAWLDVDNESAFNQLTNYLLDLDHKHIGVIDALPGHAFAEDRKNGHKRALVGRGHTFNQELYIQDRFTVEAGFRSARMLLLKVPRPTALVVGSMMGAIGAYQAIRSLNFEVGRDVSVIAHDDVFSYFSPTDMVPSLTTTRSSIRAAGKKIAETLVKSLTEGTPLDLAETWPVELIVRNSTGRVG